MSKYCLELPLCCFAARVRARARVKTRALALVSVLRSCSTTAFATMQTMSSFVGGMAATVLRTPAIAHSIPKDAKRVTLVVDTTTPRALRIAPLLSRPAVSTAALECGPMHAGVGRVVFCVR